MDMIKSFVLSINLLMNEDVHEAMNAIGGILRRKINKKVKINHKVQTNFTKCNNERMYNSQLYSRLIG